MNTKTFDNQLSFQYAIEELQHSGFRKDPSETNLDSATYRNEKQYQGFKVVMNRRYLTADVYCGNGLLTDLPSFGRGN